MDQPVLPCKAAVAVLLAAALLAACGGGSEVGKPGAAVKESRSSTVMPKDMLAMVPSSKEDSPLDLRFDIGSKPLLGKPFEVSLAVLSSAPGVRSFTIVFESSDALEVTSGAKWAVEASAKSSKVHTHSVTVVPHRAGVFYVPVVALVRHDEAAASRSFSIPVIVGVNSPAAANL